MKSNKLFHIYNRGNWKEEVFREHDDYINFYNILKLCFHPFQDIPIICIMPNHYHLIANQRDKQNISKCMHRVGVIYTKYFNKKYKTVGHTFQGPYNAKQIKDLDYFKKIVEYIKANPSEANLTKSYKYMYVNEILLDYYQLFFNMKFDGEDVSNL